MPFCDEWKNASSWRISVLPGRAKAYITPSSSSTAPRLRRCSRAKATRRGSCRRCSGRRQGEGRSLSRSSPRRSRRSGRAGTDPPVPSRRPAAQIDGQDYPVPRIDLLALRSVGTRAARKDVWRFTRAARLHQEAHGPERAPPAAVVVAGADCCGDPPLAGLYAFTSFFSP